jgi:glycosyltransferase involved in cell wall biosynthesis
MVILFISDVPLYNPTSGSELVLNKQATGLKREGMKVYAITRQTDRKPTIYRDVQGVKEACYSISPKYLIRSLISLLKHPQKIYHQFSHGNSFESIICHQPFTFFSLLMSGRLPRTSLLYVFHSPSHEEYLLTSGHKHWLVNSISAHLRRLVEHICLSKATKVVVLSKYMKSRLHQIHGIPSSRIEINPGGVDLGGRRIIKKRDYFKKKLDFPKNKIHLLSVRNLELRMGLDSLIKSIYILKDRKMPVHLFIVGEGVERNKLERLIYKYELNKDIVMTGYVSNDLLPEYYGASDFFILPTRHLEGFGLVTPESMACGTPVLGTPVGGTKEILSKFNPEFLFNDTSPESIAHGIQMAVQNYFDNKRKYSKLRERCREYAKNYYSWERHVNQLISIINDMQNAMSIH